MSQASGVSSVEVREIFNSISIMFEVIGFDDMMRLPSECVTICVCLSDYRVDTEDGEAITSAEILTLNADGGAPKNYIAIATNSSFNEEVSSKGRVGFLTIVSNS